MTPKEYSEKLMELMTEGSQYGIATVAVVIDFDPIRGTEKTDVLHRQAGPIAIGGAAVVLMNYASDLMKGRIT